MSNGQVSILISVLISNYIQHLFDWNAPQNPRPMSGLLIKGCVEKARITNSTYLEGTKVTFMNRRLSFHIFVSFIFVSVPPVFCSVESNCHPLAVL